MSRVSDRLKEQAARQQTAPVAPVAQETPVAQQGNNVPEPEQEAPALPKSSVPAGTYVSHLADSDPSKGLKLTQTPGWQDLPYEELVKKSPEWTPAQYLYQKSKYLRENGLPEMSYLEQADVLRGRDPFETEKERHKEEKRVKNVRMIEGVGDFLGNLANYIRAKNGHVAMRLPAPGQYNRADKIREGQLALQRSHYKDYMHALGLDAAERKRQSDLQAARDAEQRKLDADIQKELFKRNSPYEQARARTQEKQADYYGEKARGAKMDNENKPKKDAAELGLIRARINKLQEERNGRTGSDKYIELDTPRGKKRFTPEEHGSNWIQRAYNEMLIAAGDEKSKYEVYDLFGKAPSNQDMYSAITKYNADQWSREYRTDRYKGGENAEKPPLE